MKIKVRKLGTTGRGLIVQRDDSTGDPGRDDVTEDFKRHPDKYEVIESTAGRTTFTESTRKVRVTFDAAKDPRHAAKFAEGLRKHEAEVAKAKKAAEAPKPLTADERKNLRRRTQEAFQRLGLSEAESKVAAEADGDVLEDCWEVVCGSRAAAKIARRL